ncbi:flagellar hook-length control protein FliK [Thiogranum longum]|uniref:Flagellar hook-length control protein FliK n=1 Tax=Thiogranum longum TaxID=1537524 RepID=A0A4R1HA60_9GAMM|nr:flagellar hook-length control protein FliK [Thiogranum longum]TCK18814.1 flagellar hook-length control protein FliK [Thiogranum longum]
METSGPTSGSPPVTGTNVAATTIRWQVGQLLQATVAESLAGKILLSIGNRQVSSDSSLPLEKGQQLTVQVRSLGEVPVLRITSGPASTTLAQAMRTLTPQQDSMTPLLASLSRLANTPQPPVPPLIRELTRSMMRNLPDTAAVTRPDTLRTAIERSGLLLERHLAQQANRPSAQSPGPGPVAAIEKDFKANLLQLIDRLRNWPGSTPGPRAPSVARSPVAPTLAAAPVVTTPGTLRDTPLAPPASTVRGGNSSTGNPSPTGGTSPANTAPATSTVSADQLHRALQSGVRTPLADARPVPVSTPLPVTAALPTAGTSSGSLLPALPGPVLPPFPGGMPAPQAAVQATIDLANRIGNLRTDLLRQAEAALARIQLHQLASQPREVERGLLEWLFELPVRRGDDIDLWSMRFAREQADPRTKKRQAQHRWSVQLAFDLPGLGPVQAQITLRGERVSTRFWTGNEEALPLFRDNLQALQKMFGKAGLETGELDCVPGPMPTGATAPSLIREKI